MLNVKYSRIFRDVVLVFLCSLELFWFHLIGNTKRCLHQKIYKIRSQIEIFANIDIGIAPTL